ncbi:hypothetical protein FE257_010791 [Aspergillus nanangensis]|uniref:Uncharacterized protein n=1 Tax=Aspergillus nanangensis TaxID=2582783 RepID=A0AAD4CVH9_ASPNN|nr:hypothetical protein FE257_010791 [Aspergillus nanangensis]
MAITVPAQVVHPPVRHFSAHRRHSQSRMARTVAMSYLVAIFIVPFIPPALKSMRQKNSDYAQNDTPYPPLCCDPR